MEDVFYLCPREINMPKIKELFEKIPTADEHIGHADDECIQICFDENGTERFIEFYIFSDIWELGADVMPLLKKEEIKTAVGILHHTRHLDKVLKYTRVLMENWGGILGTDNDGLEPYYSPDTILDFDYGCGRR